MNAVKLAWLAVVVILAGCGDRGPKMVPVSGRVQLDGQPVAEGFISFVPSEPPSAPAVRPLAIKNGEFSGEASPGKNRIYLLVYRKPAGPISDVPGGADPGSETVCPVGYEPDGKEYRDVLTNGSNTYVFDAHSK